jgi:hypothetical protein
MSAPVVYGGLPTAPPGDIGTDQGAVKPDIPSFKWPKPTPKPKPK